MQGVFLVFRGRGYGKENANAKGKYNIPISKGGLLVKEEITNLVE